MIAEEVGVVEHYKHLGDRLNSRLAWKTNCDAVYKNGMSRLLPVEAQIFQGIQQDYSKCNLLFYGLLGERHLWINKFTRL